jgi:hypothetical protein
VTEQHEPQNDLTQPGFRDRQVKQPLILLGLRRKRLRQPLGTLGSLLIDKAPADLVTLGQLCHRLGARQSLDCYLLALLGVQLMGCTTHRRA